MLAPMVHKLKPKKNIQSLDNIDSNIINKPCMHQSHNLKKKNNIKAKIGCCVRTTLFKQHPESPGPVYHFGTPAYHIPSPSPVAREPAVNKSFNQV